MVNLEVLEVFFCQKVHFRGLEAFRGFRGKSGHPGNADVGLFEVMPTR